MYGILTNDEIEVVLEKQSIGRIGCHAAGKTYVVPIRYVYDGKYIYCHAHNGMKINMMRQNPEVCFEVDSIDKNDAWTSVITWGRFEEIINREERNRALKKILSQASPVVGSKSIKIELGMHYPFAPDDLNTVGGIIFTIEPREKTGRFEINENAFTYNGS